MSRKNRQEKSELRQFGIILGVILFLMVLYQWWRHDRLWEEVAIVGGVFLVVGFISPKALKPVYGPWMWGAEKIGFVMNRVILTIFFLVILTPFAVVRRLFNRDPLGLKWDPNRSSYFEAKTLHPADRFKNLF